MSTAMALQDLATALERARKVLQRRPAMGLHEDSPALARWQGGTRVLSTHANGTAVVSDMPTEVGGSGDRVTPGWLFRAGLASCATTRIAMGAAAAGIELTTLEVLASSRSDTRGLLGMSDDDGKPINASPRDVELRVRISAAGVSPERLRVVIEESLRSSPIPSAVQSAIHLGLQIDVEAA